MTNAGMPMPALVFLMPMPTYALVNILKQFKQLGSPAQDCVVSLSVKLLIMCVV
jgi:hypothetical protein